MMIYQTRANINLFNDLLGLIHLMATLKKFLVIQIKLKNKSVDLIKHFINLSQRPEIYLAPLLSTHGSLLNPADELDMTNR